MPIALKDASIENPNKFLFLYESIYAMAVDKFLYLFNFFREIVVRTRHPGGNGNFSPGKKFLSGEKLPFPSGWRVRMTISWKKNQILHIYKLKQE